MIRSATLLALGAVLALALAPASAGGQERIRVDFGERVRAAPLSGLLHGAGPKHPSRRLIHPLRPGLWRLHFERPLYRRALAAGARFQLMISEHWGYPVDRWRGRGPPWGSLGRWRKFTTDMARRHRRRKILWDVWNEPDGIGGFWEGSRRQFFETYLVAYRALRRTLGRRAVIGGPSISRFDPDYLRDFLEFCRARGCEVNFLSWHEFPGTPAGVPAIADHLRDVRREFLRNRRYRRLRIRELHVNEFVSDRDQYRPGDILGYLHYLEAGRADAAAKGCWLDSTGRGNCFNESLDGLVDPRTRRPRAAWWAYKEYADGRPSRVAASTSDRYLLPLASARSPGRRSAQILIAHADRPAPAPDELAATVELRGLRRLPFAAGRTRLRARLSRIPNTGEEPLARPVPIDSVPVRVRRGRASLRVGPIGRHEALLVTLR